MSALPATMPAAVLRSPGVVEVEERPVPTPGPDDVLVEVGHCGVCGSDLHLLVEGWGKPGLVGGHEWSGAVVAVGDRVTGWRVGEVVVGGPSPRCGVCRRCLEGKPSQCERRRTEIAEEVGHDAGAFAGYVVADHRSLVRLPAGLSPRAAALAEPLAVALHGITRAELAPEDSVMVLGAGPIGALTIAALVAAGRPSVVAVEPSPGRAALAARLGADPVLHPADLPLFPPWEPERMAPGAVDVAIECSGKKAAIEAGFNQLRRGGRLVLVGAGMEGPTFDPNRLLLNELQICGSFVYDADGFARALELLASGAMPTELLIEPDDVPIDRIGEALAGLAGGTIAGKVMVVPGVPDDGAGDAAPTRQEV